MRSAPFAFKQRFERVLASRHLQLPENVGLLGGLVFGLYIDVVGPFRIGACTDQNELGAS
jgi:hypothetical protein